tara:strand:- start:1493 stop:2155 length:663 start_codon:yes stop_codon:yes gene_type:complete
MPKKRVRFIVGSGFIAARFKKYLKFLKKKNVIIYAAGISNSLDEYKKNLEREVFKIKNFILNNRKKLIYISTYSVNDDSRRRKLYVKNKIKIEKIIKQESEKYMIIRLPEIIGKNKNPNTLTNFFYNKIVRNESFTVFKNSRRNLLDVDDAIKNCIKIIRSDKKNKSVVNLLNKKFNTPLQIVNNFEKILKKKGIYKFKNTKKKNGVLKTIIMFIQKRII